MKKGRMIMLSMSVILFVSCKKDTGEPAPAPPPEVLTDHQKHIAALTKEVAGALEQVYENNAAYNEVNAAIVSGYYQDERVLLKDLLFPSVSELYQAETFRKLKIDTGAFRRRFCEIIERGNYPLLSAELKPAFTKVKPMRSAISGNFQIVNDNYASVLSATQPVCIYFPYSENFTNLRTSDSFPSTNKMIIMKKPTLVYTDRDADVAPGRDPYYCRGLTSSLCYRDVMVDDAYAEVSPTHIVTTGANRQDTSVREVLKTELVHRAYHGTSRLIRQMDKLVSFTGNGGGSEIKVCRINGFLRRTDEHVSDFSGDLVTLLYTRADIRKKRWKRVFSVWDPNWNYQDIEQIYAVYEEDNQGSRTFDGSLKTTLNLPAKLGKVEGDLGFKIQVTTQDEVIMQRKLDRKSFFRDGQNNQGWGFLPDTQDFLPLMRDWPVFDGGSIWQYTLPYRIY